MNQKDFRLSFNGFFVVLGFLLCFFLMPASLSAAFQVKSPPKILLIHSYDSEYPWTIEINRGTHKALAGKQVELETIYMDTKRKTTDEWKTEAGKEAMAKIESWHPDVVIAADDNAQIFVTQNYIGKKPVFIFCGVSADPATYGFPTSNVTGIVEWPFFQETVDYLKSLLGPSQKIRSIAFMSDTCPSSLEGFIRGRSEKFDEKVIGYHLVNNLATWKERILQYNRKADALVFLTYHTLQTDDIGFSASPQAVMDWTVENCEIPTAALYDFTVRDGVFCGYTVSGEEQGYEAARMALEVLGGTPVDKIPVRKPTKGLKMINLKTAKKLGIEISEKAIAEADEVIR